MRKVITLSTVLLMASTLSANADMQTQIDQLTKKVKKLEKKQARQNKKISAVNKLANKDNLKLSADFRTTFDGISYKNAKGDKYTNGIFSNRLWVKMAYAPTNKLAFYSTLAYNKMYGQTTVPAQGFNYYDWVVNETVNASDELRVKEAYWLYKNDTFLSLDIPWTASIGRRPSTDGLLVNYREDQKAKSAIGHNINMEFDGASFNYVLENITDVSGMSMKFCFGRGMSNVKARFNGVASTPAGQYNLSPSYDYTKASDYSNTDLVGILFNPYNDGQYSLHTVWFKAYNLPGMVATSTRGTYDFKQVGDVSGGAVSFVADGIGDGLSDMLDETIIFASAAYSKTDPKTRMLGSTKSEVGESIYVGANWPCQITDDARVGVEFNKGSANWRSFTYGEDTLAGSKLATRGNAYEMWFSKDLIGKTLKMQIRYTYMDYKYSGSNGFFGDAGKPVATNSAMAKTMGVLTEASDLRINLRYRY